MLLLPATLTAHEATATQRLLGQALRREPEGDVIVDASQLTSFDSAVLAVLLECWRLANAMGRSFHVHGAPSKLLALATLYGVNALLIETLNPAVERMSRVS